MQSFKSDQTSQRHQPTFRRYSTDLQINSDGKETGGRAQKESASFISRQAGGPSEQDMIAMLLQSQP
jgi:hypothetical protein